MLKLLKIKNFQAHSHIKLKFAPGVNTIIGRNDKGKSAILRAIKFLVRNRPVGNEFVKHGMNSTFIRLTTEEDNIITRVKGEKKNYYKLNGKKFSAFKTDVPEEITNSLLLSEVNFQGQYDSPFWFTESAGEISKKLNAIVNLEAMDQTMASLNSKARSLNSTLTAAIANEIALKNDLENLSYVKEIDKDLELCEKLKNRYDVGIKNCGLLDDVIHKVQQLNSIIDLSSNINNDFASLDSIFTEYQYQKTQTDKLKILLQKLNEAEQESKKEVPSIEHLEKLRIRIREITSGIKNLTQIIESIKTKESLLQNSQKEVDELEKDLHKLTKGVCPLCQRPM